jgi:UDP-N-acetylglucosamine 2-epimerase (non-hydrolysing)
MQKVIIICGTRPEAIKLIPIYLKAKKRVEIETMLVSTGQHREMLDQIFNLFDIKPDIDLSVMVANQSLSGLTSILFKELSECFDRINPDMVVVQGDTTSAMVASMVAFYLKIKVAHVEAGLRTNDKFSPFPEEMNRRVISLTANLNFAPTEKAALALTSEKVEKVEVVGNTVIDCLFIVDELVRKNSSYYHSIYSEIFQSNKNNILVTGHRRESFGEGFLEICEALKMISNLDDKISIIYPVHLNPNVKNVVYELLNNIPNIHLIDPIPYDHMAYLMRKSYIILTDSGGVQEEAPSFNKPVVVMRNITERMEGVDAGCSVLAGNNSESIFKAFSTIYNDPVIYKKMSSVVNPYGDGNSSQRIVESILKSIYN